jgi:hypothetical protein
MAPQGKEDQELPQKKKGKNKPLNTTRMEHPKNSLCCYSGAIRVQR